jgi:hypothetical protein
MGIPVGEHVFPENTPLEAMSGDQREAYWRFHARRHEDRWKAMGDYEQLKAKAAQYDTLLAETQTEQQKAVTEAEARGRQAALTEAGAALVEQWVRAAAAGRLDQQRVDALLAGLDRSAFLAPGGVDTDKVFAWVGSVAPAPAAPAPGQPAPGQPPVGGPPGGPAAPAAPAGMPPAPTVPWQPVAPFAAGGGIDFGQGHHTTTTPTGLDAGRAAYAARHGGTNRTSTPQP